MNGCFKVVCLLVPGLIGAPMGIAEPIVFEAGHSSLHVWKLPLKVPQPKSNALTAARVELGRELFFDAELSVDGSTSCATCHHPDHAWADGRPTAVGLQGEVLGRASPSILNVAFNGIQMWDGRAPTLEAQAIGPMENPKEMATDFAKAMARLSGEVRYRELFDAAYPGEPIGEATVTKAIAAFERTVVSNNTRFDRWISGDEKALSRREINGFRVFVGKAACTNCHMPPNFTDDGFHDLGIESENDESFDPGRFHQVPLGIMKGAFKTPSLRNVARTAPYFHNGSARTLMEVVEHYLEVPKQGGVSPNMPVIELSRREKGDLVRFMALAFAA